jgi:flagellar hook protein FlgE
MSITSAMFTGVSGLLANADAINVIGNNLANANTTGFKSSRTLFSDMLYSNIGNNSEVGRGTQIQKVSTLYTQGSFETTSNVTDLAIQGDGLFAVTDGTTTYYTRAGAFSMDANGQYLVNSDGMRLVGAGGAALDFSGCTDFSKITQIDTDGTVTWANSSGTTATLATKIGMATCANPGGLKQVGDTLYSASSESGAVTVAAATANNEITSDSLEQSNVDMASEFVKMIITQRAYSANSKTITTADEMTQEVLNLKR